MKSLLLTAAGSIIPVVTALGQQPVISFTNVKDAFQLAGGTVTSPQILVSDDDFWGVIRAAGDLAKDFGRVTGTNFSLSNGNAGASPASYEYHPAASNYTVVCVEHIVLHFPVSYFYSTQPMELVTSMVPTTPTHHQLTP